MDETPTRRSRWVGRSACALLAAGLSFAPQAARATTTRVWTLGAMNRFILDDANRWLYPHTIAQFGNLFYIELFGLGDSLGTAAPGSERTNGRDAPAADLALGGGGVPADVSKVSGFNSLTGADFVPVLSTSGGGAILGLTENIFIAVHLSDYENPLVRNFLLGPLASVSNGNPNRFPWLSVTATQAGVESANRKLDIAVAYSIPDVLSLGLMVSHASSKLTFSPNSTLPQLPNNENRVDDVFKVNEWRFLLSGGYQIGDSAAIDAAFGMAFHTLTSEPNLNNLLIDGGGGVEFQADVRAFIGVTEWWELVPALSIRSLRISAADLARYDRADGPLTYNNSAPDRRNVEITDVSQSSFLFDMGLVAHFRPNEVVSFWGGAGLQFAKVSEQYTHGIAEDLDNGIVRGIPYEFSANTLSTDAVPWLRLALEAKVFSWLDVRGGVVKFIRAQTQSIDLQNDEADRAGQAPNRLLDATTDEPFFDYFVGAAAHYEGFFLDLQLDPNWFKRGPNALSGSSGNMFLNASLGYRY